MDSKLDSKIECLFSNYITSEFGWIKMETSPLVPKLINQERRGCRVTLADTEIYMGFNMIVIHIKIHFVFHNVINLYPTQHLAYFGRIYKIFHIHKLDR